MREFSKNIKAVTALAPAVRTASATGGTVDRIGYDGLAFLISTGAWTDGTHTVVAEESTDNSTWTAVDASNLSGTLPAVAAAGQSNSQTLLGYMGDARYVRIKSNVTGSPATGAVIGATVLLGRARVRPAA